MGGWRRRVGRLARDVCVWSLRVPSFGLTQKKQKFKSYVVPADATFRSLKSSKLARKLAQTGRFRALSSLRIFIAETSEAETRSARILPTYLVITHSSTVIPAKAGIHKGFPGQISILTRPKLSGHRAEHTFVHPNRLVHHHPDMSPKRVIESWTMSTSAMRIRSDEITTDCIAACPTSRVPPRTV